MTASLLNKELVGDWDGYMSDCLKGKQSLLVTFKWDTNQHVNVIQDSPLHDGAHLCLLPYFTSDDPCSALKPSRQLSHGYLLKSFPLRLMSAHHQHLSSTDTCRSHRRTLRICFPSCKVGTKPEKAFRYFIISENDDDEGPNNHASHIHIWPETQATFTQHNPTHHRLFPDIL